MSEDKKNIDLWLNEQMDKLHYQATEQDWVDFEKVYFKKKKKRGIFWLWFLAGGIAACSIYLIIQPKQQKSKQLSISSHSDERLDIVLQSTSVNNESVDKEVSKQSFPEQSIQNNFSSTQKTTQANFSRKKRSYVDLSTKKLSNSLTEEISDEESKEYIKTITAKEEDKLISNKTDSVETKLEELFKSDSTSSQQINYPIKIAKKDNSEKHKIYVSNLTSYAFSREMSFTNPLNGLSIKPKKNRDLFIELNVGVVLNKRFSIQTGVGLYQSSYQTNYTQQIANVTPTSSQVTNLNIDTATKKIRKVVYTVTNYDTSYTSNSKDGKVTSSYIYIPINIRYQFLYKKFSFGVNGGFNYYIKSSISYEGEGLNGLLLTPQSYKSMNLGMDINYTFSRHFSIGLGLTQYSFINNQYQALLNNQRLYTVNSSIKYTF
ncbi:MAG: hypothetical protein HYZ42_06170 [Bacteroidetes bacterium]|nr:hypothetical protein [Bacteroidota bacterium]